ncbi:MAG: response regulator transcription factor [Firmicutes bacterium]|nr:response regulator transcription factor [Bacillota bacterium]
MSREKTILVVEDETPVSQALKACLNNAGYRVEQVFDGEEALGKFPTLNPALVILDATLPGINGRQVLKEIRKRSSCPVIMLTPSGKMEEKLASLNQGADDCIAKPFAAEEVVARVNAVLRRPVHIFAGETRQYGSLKIDFQAQTVYLHGVELPLIPRDLSLLLFLARHPNQTFTRKQLIEEVWGLDYQGSERAVDLAVKRLRKALRDWPASEGELKTLRGLGYQLRIRRKNGLR